MTAPSQDSPWRSFDRAASAASNESHRARRTRLLLAVGLGVVSALVALRSSGSAEIHPARAGLRLDLAQATIAVEPAPVAGNDPQTAGPRADVALRRAGRDFIGGGFMAVPDSFASQDGRYDLVVHFHGNTNLVEDGYRATKLNAPVLILNYGVGSGVYAQRFAHPAVLADILDRVRQALQDRGLRDAKLGRLALGAWSAGYGAISNILKQAEFSDAIDAVLLFDGLHCGYGSDRRVDLERLDPFVRFARLAVDGQKLFSITHSDIRPDGDYAGTREATDAILDLLHVHRQRFREEPPLPMLASMRGVLPDRLMRPLEPLTEARAGRLVVRGYAGAQEQHHVMHLVQMSVTGLPDLVQHWSGSAKR